MTLLADRLIQARGGMHDLGGMIGLLANKIEHAQRFVMNREAAQACLKLLRARPSGLTKVMPVCRLPYDTMWMELESGIGENYRDPLVAPVPLRQGTLIESWGDQHGVMTVAWVHPPKPGVDEEFAPNASPYSLYFDFREDGDAGELVRMYHQKVMAGLKEKNPTLASYINLVIERMERFNMPRDDEGIREFMATRSWWHQWADDPREVEALRLHSRHMQVGLSPIGLGAILAALEFGAAMGDVETFARFMRSWEQDIEGEGPYAQFFIAMLNSRNCVEREAISMIKLNKARAKRHDERPPLLDHTVIKLVMSKARARAARAHGLSPTITREQLVMGHFKARRTGVFWWHPFERYTGRGLQPSLRTHYEVEA